MPTILYNTKHLNSKLFTDNISGILVISNTIKQKRNGYFWLSAFFMIYIVEWNLLKKHILAFHHRNLRLKSLRRRCLGKITRSMETLMKKFKSSKVEPEEQGSQLFSRVSSGFLFFFLMHLTVRKKTLKISVIM